MAFQRSCSKVWWGSDYNQSLAAQELTTQLQPTPVDVSTVVANVGCYASKYLTSMQSQQNHSKYQQPQYHSLDYHNLRAYAANLTRIQEVDDAQNMSKLSWEKRHSPGSLRSQDSGFSDNDESHSSRVAGAHSPKQNSPSGKSNLSVNTSSNDDSPASSPRSHIATPPTVVRRVGKSQFFSPLVSVSRRISFNGTPVSEQNMEMTPIENQMDYEDNKESELNSPAGKQTQKRRRRVSRQLNKPVSPNRRCLSPNNKLNEQPNEAIESKTSTNPTYNNETVYLGADSSFLMNNNTLTSLNLSNVCASTPKTMKTVVPLVYENPLLNGHGPALQQWLIDLRNDGEPDVMSTLQTKSIAQEAFKNLTITTNTVVKLIRQMQQRATYLQTDFERLERI